ncbi:hypothetical protein C1645_823475 [Glomus cerebriforme]|uniref:Uncharacterized protein n=1 Tax=Glomus cerebriforme TaxID=658196 RepID=A0A397SWH5_9GLOM|nr:hypothetical protein C1645_823475 [Glomus cerebriforme]
MHYRQFRNTNELVQLALNSFLNRINYNNIYLLPYNNNAHILAVQSRRVSRRSQRLTGKILMKRNVEHEAHRLQVHNRYLINLATDYIWNVRSSTSQRNRFTNLANNANNLSQNQVSRINNTNTLDRIARITTPQQTINNSFESAFFNGTKFDDNNSFESLILPAGCSGPSSSFI